MNETRFGSGLTFDTIFDDFVLYGNSLPSICDSDDMLARLFATTYAQLFVKNIQVTKIRSHQLSPGNDAPHDSNMQCIHPVVPLALTQDPQDHQDG